MPKGELALVLHAHLPYVKSAETGSLEEDWFFQALLECYLPILERLEDSYESNIQQPKITIGLSPTLLSLLEDKDLKKRFPSWLKSRIQLLGEVKNQLQDPANHLIKNISHQLINWENCNGDIISRFGKLQQKGVVDLLTCAATHGYLPLLREHPQAVIGQLKTAIREHCRLFNTKPLGIWLPECAYYEGLDSLMMKAGLKYAVLDGHGLLNASPRPRFGLYAPICTKNGVAFFGRDSESTLPVWSAREGYPGNSVYREFHRDLGWDIPIEKLKKLGIRKPRPLGLKLYKVTSQNLSLEKKDIYEPELAALKIKEHAQDYLKKRKEQLNRISNIMGQDPLLIAPFDAELFGHWWFEGPDFLAELFKQAIKMGIKFTTLKEVLKKQQKLQLCEPSPSSWGQGGYHNYWLNENNAWIVPEWNKASKAMIEVSNFDLPNKLQVRILKQAARELLLSQSSDWSFILRAGTTTKLAKDRFNLHLKRFWKLINSIKEDSYKSKKLLDKFEKEDALFPEVDAKDWK